MADKKSDDRFTPEEKRRRNEVAARRAQLSGHTQKVDSKMHRSPKGERPVASNKS